MNYAKDMLKYGFDDPMPREMEMTLNKNFLRNGVNKWSRYGDQAWQASPVFETRPI